MLVIFTTLEDETCSKHLNAQTSAVGYSFGIQSVLSVVKHWTCSDNALLGGWLNILFSLTSGLCSWLKLFSSPSSCGAQLCFSGNIFSSKLGVFLPCSSNRFWNFSSVLYNKVSITTKSLISRHFNTNAVSVTALEGWMGTDGEGRQSTRSQPGSSNSQTCRRLGPSASSDIIYRSRE